MKKIMLSILLLLLSINNAYAIKGLTKQEMRLEQIKELKFKKEYREFHKKHGADYNVLKKKPIK